MKQMDTNTEALQPTAEQQDIINAAARGESFMAIAGAGSAKTTTLKMLSPQLRGTILAVAFNRRIVEDLTKAVPSTFIVKTLNSIGHSAWQRQRGQQQTLKQDKMAAIVTDTLKERAPILRQRDED